MPAISSTAPGKVILFGEHAVVYGRPAIAVPVAQVRARAAVFAEPRGSPGRVLVEAPDIGLSSPLNELADDHPLSLAIRKTLEAFHIHSPPSFTLRVTSSIPLASGLGSSAAISVAIIRALSSFLGQPLDDDTVSAIAFEVEKIHHGTPSGIDNTVVTYARPVYFVRGQKIDLLRVPQPFTLIIGDTGIASSTAAVVADVRARHDADPQHYEGLFDAAAQITGQARQLIESGRVHELGPLMNANHALLVELGVSSPELDRLVAAAREAGAKGAKLSGAGRGGNMIALADPALAGAIEDALTRAGATRTIVTQVHEPA